MLNLFRDHLTARRRSPETIRIRMVYLRQLEQVHPNLLTVTPEQLEAFIHAHSQWKPETVNAAVTSIRVFYQWAHRHGHIDRLPTDLLELAYVPRRVKVLADDDKVRGALTTAELHEQAMIRLGREAGLRRTEIASLHTSHRDGSWLNVTGKGGRLRRLHVSGDLLATLLALEQAQGDGFYFPGVTIPHVRPEKVYNTVLRLTGTSTHALRRRAGTSVYRNTGGDIRLTQEFLGHSSPSITAVYIDINDHDLVRASSAASLAA